MYGARTTSLEGWGHAWTSLEGLGCGGAGLGLGGSASRGSERLELVEWTSDTVGCRIGVSCRIGSAVTNDLELQALR